MPVATVDPNETERHELKSAPPDGYVCIRPLPYGMKLARADKAMKMQMRSTPQDRRSRGGASEVITDILTASEASSQYDFEYCIVEHNLTDPQGATLNFSNPMHFKALNPKIGSEIQKLLDKINEDEDEETLEDFLSRRSISSEEEKRLSAASPVGSERHQRETEL